MATEKKEQVEKKRGRPKKSEQKSHGKTQSRNKDKIESVEAELVEKGGVGGNGNLIPMNQRTKEEQREICTKAGVASGKARRRNKEIREMLCAFLDKEANPVIKANMQKLGVDADDMTNMMAMFASLFSKAVNHQDINALRTIMEYAGRAPLQEMRENEAIARMSQVMQLASGNNDDNDDGEDMDVVFYIPQNGRPIITDDELVTVDVD